MIFFSTRKLSKNVFWTNKKFVSFLTAQIEKNSWTKLGEQIGENIG